ncbi:hypothetical protein C8F04DRAFT_1119622 [Mycena alexandri]|uniref:Uncharacterized protein n=1 Tax=Mycena alexandri TaxID=1745969 RepID=A0AAD6SJZ5_9AGAR|nr:hypothetical protein C8F04DRAFT_1119622 [Mycena alexandri]
MLPPIPFVFVSLTLAGRFFTAPVLAQNTTNVTACNTICRLSNGTVLDLDTSGFPGTCSDSGIQQYAQCLDCIAITVEPANEDTEQFQEPLDDLIQTCTQNGFPVHSATVDGSYQSGNTPPSSGGASQPSSACGGQQVPIGVWVAASALGLGWVI